MEIGEIEYLIQKPSLTEAERKAIREAADAAGLKYTVRKECRVCYERLLLQLYELAEHKELNTSLDGWRFKDIRHSFQYGGVIYNNETIKGLRVGHLHPVIIKANFVRADKGEEAE
ncbi:MAG: hypothetical protein J6T33_02270 [Bacteroidales bacterium]|nr:hypothetical protein [Bacteroidales bacterium]